MISINVVSLEISKIRAIDSWIGENVVRARSEGEDAYRISGSSVGVIGLSFMYSEDEVAFKLTFGL